MPSRLYYQPLVLFVAALLAVSGFATSANAQTSADFSAGGSVRLGWNANACDSTTEGGIRYNSSTSCAEFCDGSDWTCPGNASCVDPASCSCPNIGDVCYDGTVYAGDSPDADAPMYAMRCDEGQSWDGSTCTGSRTLLYWNNGNGSNQEWTFIDHPRTGETNTYDIIGIDSDGGTGGVQPHQAAQRCADLSFASRSDWYLPALEEWDVLYANRVAIGNFDSGSGYWASAEDSGNITLARGIDFFDGSWYYNSKDALSPVRCVRRN